MRLTRLDQITLRTGVARATNCATAPTCWHIYIIDSDVPKKTIKKGDEADPSRPDNLANWSRTRYQLRHSPNLVPDLTAVGNTTQNFFNTHTIFPKYYCPITHRQKKSINRVNAYKKRLI
ncbi:uncharacterized protein N7529_010731 [Penicillium soppii]|uniref:uncharacterized protein n=1 Tax=Penicillium soppii TaxID=69789 RepID=UPI0025470E28|nr:uncharacterized protein N7529_010731 [Penicillium soppii]KAJ5851346.1 hypothetical protein N7529_010731 [Penicillium soppii]